MHTKKLLPITVTVALLLLTGAALADSIDFSFDGENSSSTWSWAGGSATLSAMADHITLGLVGGTRSPLMGNVLISFTTGPGTGGAGTISNPYTFGPSATGSIIVNGCLPGSGSGCTTETLFTGQFTAEQLAFVGSDNFFIDGTTVTGTLNSGVASYFGFTTDAVTGGLDGILLCGGGFFDACGSTFSGIVGSGDLILTPNSVPEPSALFLMGSGLLGLTVYIRRRRVKKA